MNTLVHIFSTVLSVSPEEITDTLSPDTNSSWDSLNAIILLTEIEKAFNVHFSYDEAMGVHNFKEVKELILSKGITL